MLNKSDAPVAGGERRSGRRLCGEAAAAARGAHGHAAAAAAHPRVWRTEQGEEYAGGRGRFFSPPPLSPFCGAHGHAAAAAAHPRVWRTEQGEWDAPLPSSPPSSQLQGKNCVHLIAIEYELDKPSQACKLRHVKKRTRADRTTGFVKNEQEEAK